MKSAVIISGPMAQDHEFIYPYYRLLEEKIKLDVCLIGGKPVSGILGTPLPPNKNHTVKDIDQLNVNDYDLLVLPGGVKAMEKIRQDKRLISFISNFHKADKLIACICSGVFLMISAKIVKNKNITGYYAWKDDIENAGATFVDSPVVVDENIVTSPHYKFVGEWMGQVLKNFKKL